MIRYSFKDKPLTIKGGKKANPQKIGEELARLGASNAGHIRPKDVIEAARNPRSALHKLIEWDDAKAADSYRLDQAREIIRIIRVEVDEAPPQRAFLSVNDGKTSYRTAQEVRSSVHLQDLVLRSALKELQAFQKRYAEIEDVCSDLQAAQDKITARLKAA